MRKLSILLFLLALAATATFARAAGDTLTLTSEPGDVFGERQYSYAQRTSEFLFGSPSSPGDLVCYVIGPGAQPNWRFEIRQPGKTPFRPGIYTLGGSARQSFRVFRGDTVSFAETGHFEIKKMIYGPAGEVAALWFTFALHTGGAEPALRGEYRFQADSTAPTADQTPCADAGLDRTSRCWRARRGARNGAP